MRLVIVGGSDAGISAGLSAHELARHIQAGLAARGVQVQTGTAVKAIGRGGDRLRLDCSDGTVRDTDLVLVVTGVRPVTVEATADDHKAYYAGATPIRIRLTGDAATGRLLGAQIVGSLGAEIAKRVDVLATGIHHGITIEQVNDLDLSYTPPLGSPWDTLQHTAQAWTRAARRPLAS